MVLLKINKPTRKPVGIFRRQAPTPAQWYLCAGLCLGSLILAFWGEPARLLFRYETGITDSGQYWRLLTAHFVHLGWSHFLLNAVGLILVWFIYAAVFGVREWLFIILLSGLGISGAFTLFDANLVWYVGLSGILHALLSAALVYVLMNTLFTKGYSVHSEDAVLMLGLILKLGYEQLYGAIAFTESGSGGPVIVNAHFYGAIMGCLCAVFLFQFTKFKSDQARKHSL